MPKAAPPRTTRLEPARLLTSLAPLLHEWLPRQRWFAGKGRPVTDFDLVTATELLPGVLHLLVRTEQPVLRAPGEVAAPTPADCYQLLIGVSDQLPPRLAPALIGRATTGPLAGGTVYDALQDPRSAGLLLERLRSPGTVGPLRFEGAPDVDVPPGLTPRLLGVEQSNSSLVYGDTFILKVFRRVQPGVNPDLELPWALARRGCARVPAPAAWFRTCEPEEATLGVLQPFLRGADDGWTLALASLAQGRAFTGEAYELGRATAEVHLSLAEAFPRVTLGRPQTALLAAAMTERLDATARAVPALVPYVPGLRAAFEAVSALDSAGTAQRVHGDLHLGQALRPAEGPWSVIDFEGEPAPARSPNAAARSPRSATWRACCAPSTTRPARPTRRTRGGPRSAGPRTARATRRARAGTRASRPSCCAPTRPTRRCTRCSTRPATAPTGCPCRWRRSTASPSPEPPCPRSHLRRPTP